MSRNARIKVPNALSIPLVMLVWSANADALAPRSGAATSRGVEVGNSEVEVTGRPGCQATEGKYDPAGTLGWEPSCAGEWLVDPGAPLSTMSVVGVPSLRSSAPFTPDFAKLGKTSALIQAIANKERSAEIALLINFDVARGGSTREGNNKVGLADFVRLHPNSDGAKPGSTWAFNPDIQVAAGSGNVLAINTEADFNNFNDCNGPGCFSVMLWHNYLSSHPITADTYISGDSDTYRGVARVNGFELVSVSGAPFTRDTTTVEVGGRLIRVLAFNGARSLRLTESLGVLPNVKYSWHAHLVHTGILISNDNAVVDQDFLSSSSGYYAFYLNGHHNVLLSAASDAAPYAVVARPGQAICFNGVDGCLLNTDAVRLRYQVKGNAVFEAVGTEASTSNFVVMQNGPRAARIGVDGSAATAPLELSGKNGAPVSVVGSPLKLPIYKIAALPSCQAEAMGEEVFVADIVANAPAVWHGIVRGGGDVQVRSVAACNGAYWQYE